MFINAYFSLWVFFIAALIFYIQKCVKMSLLSIGIGVVVFFALNLSGV